MISIFVYTKHLLILMLLLIISLYGSSQDRTNYKVKTVVIDAGHGGKDPGAIGKKAKEKNITLAIALKVGKYIEENIKDVKVIYTRTSDKFIELHKRAEIANSNKADLFISIHVNSTVRSTPYGTSTYVMGLHKSAENLDLALTENSVILIEDNYRAKYEGYDPNSPESYIIMNMYQNIYLEQSLLFASKVQSQLKEKARRHDLGVKQAGLLVLWKTTMPSVLIETGFISNLKEEKYLLTDDGQSFIASAIYRAFKEYKAEIEKQYSSSTTKTQLMNIKSEFKQGIWFKIQIKSSQVPIDTKSTEFKGYKDVETSIVDGMYKYTIGSTTNYNEIVKLQGEIRKHFPDAFVIAIKDGEKISLNQALKESNQN